MLLPSYHVNPCGVKLSEVHFKTQGHQIYILSYNALVVAVKNVSSDVCSGLVFFLWYSFRVAVVVFARSCELLKMVSSPGVFGVKINMYKLNIYRVKLNSANFNFLNNGCIRGKKLPKNESYFQKLQTTVQKLHTKIDQNNQTLETTHERQNKAVAYPLR